jgi:YVTN family beta-propeller protein
VTVGGLNQVKVFRTDNFEQVATIPVGNLPHGVWPSGDGTRIYVGLENADALAAIDTLTNKVIATIPIGHAPQAITYVPDAVPDGAGTDNLQPLGLAGEAAHLALLSSLRSLRRRTSQSDLRRRPSPPRRISRPSPLPQPGHCASSALSRPRYGTALGRKSSRSCDRARN